MSADEVGTVDHGSSSTVPVQHQQLGRCVCRTAQARSTDVQARQPRQSDGQGSGWRVDVTICNGSLAKIMRPSVMMQLVLGDGRIHTFEVSLEQLNQLRYGVAKLLHDMRVMERHPIMRITDEFHKRENDEKNK